MGGTVLVTFIAGMVSTAIQNQACTLALGNAPTGGSAVTTSLALAASIQAKPVGTLFVPTPGCVAVAVALLVAGGLALGEPGGVAGGMAAWNPSRYTRQANRSQSSSRHVW